MTNPPGAQAYMPEGRASLTMLSEAAQHCRGCDLYRGATQAVFGRGPRSAPLMLVGEQPGDQEDIQGEPFVGPAGRLLDEVMSEVGLDRQHVYVTNAVKHFKHTVTRGKRRLHKKPSAREVHACRPWLERELELVAPAMLICLGATAAQALIGRTFRLTQHLGEVQPTPWAPWTLATLHPSALLRMPDRSRREEATAQFRRDMALAASHLRGLS